MEIYYINSENKKIDLTTWPYRIQTGDIFNTLWNYESTHTYKNGGKITKFSKQVQEFTILLSIGAESKKKYSAALNTFFETTEKDILTLTPGRLYVEGQYLRCYIYESLKSEWESGCSYLDTEIKIVSEYPFWISENMNQYNIKEIQSSGNKSYPNKYAYRYPNGTNNAYIHNHYFHNSDFKMIIYGPVLNPLIDIDGQVYSFQITLDTNEYLEIDSSKKSIEKILQKGERLNYFSCRNKQYDVFKAIPSGLRKINWSGSFSFDITLYHERSEPRWNS